MPKKNLPFGFFLLERNTWSISTSSLWLFTRKLWSAFVILRKESQVPNVVPNKYSNRDVLTALLLIPNDWYSTSQLHQKMVGCCNPNQNIHHSSPCGLYACATDIISPFLRRRWIDKHPWNTSPQLSEVDLVFEPIRDVPVEWGLFDESLLFPVEHGAPLADLG